MADDSAGWWERSHKPTVFAGIALLISVFVIAIVVIVAGKVDFSWLKSDPRKEERPAEIQLQPYALSPKATQPTNDWPTSPSYRHWHSGKPIAAIAPRATQGAAGDSAPAEQEEAPLPKGDFVAAAESGQKIYVPNRSGQCKLIGATGKTLVQSLDECFSGPTER